MNKDFIRVRTIKDITISSALFISGIILVVLPISTSINIFGFFSLMTGGILLVFLKTGWQDAETKEPYCEKDRYFSIDNKLKILNALENHLENIDIFEDGKGEGLRMDIYYNKQNHKAFIYLFEYIPYNYEPVCAALEYTTDEIEKLLD